MGEPWRTAFGPLHAERATSRAPLPASPSVRQHENGTAVAVPGFVLAEDGGFEPPRVLSQHDFQSCALGHYANPPRVRLLEGEPPPKSSRCGAAGCHDREMGNHGRAIRRRRARTDGAGTATSVASISPTRRRREPAEPSVLDRVRSGLAGTTARQVLGWVPGRRLGRSGSWPLWVTQPRLVPQDFLADDLARGGSPATGSSRSTRTGRGGRMSGPYRVDVHPASDDQDGVVDGAADGRPVTVAYWVDAPVAGAARARHQRALLGRPRGAGREPPGRRCARGRRERLLPRPAVGSGRPMPAPRAPGRRLPGGRPRAAPAARHPVVLVLDRRRTARRWAVPIFAVAELLRPRYEADGTVHPPGVAGRWSGLAGFARGAGARRSAVGWVLIALTGLSPIWFLRG